MKIKNLISLGLLLMLHCLSCTPNNVPDVPKQNTLSLTISPLISTPQNMTFLE